MSLIESMMEDAVIMLPECGSDGEGGQNVRYREGNKIRAVFAMTNAVKITAAEKAALENVFTITTGRETVLQFHDIVKRRSDGRTFRITSNSNDKKTPASSAMYPFAQVQAEEWRLPE